MKAGTRKFWNTYLDAFTFANPDAQRTPITSTSFWDRFLDAFAFNSRNRNSDSARWSSRLDSTDAARSQYKVATIRNWSIPGPSKRSQRVLVRDIGILSLATILTAAPLLFTILGETGEVPAVLIAGVLSGSLMVLTLHVTETMKRIAEDKKAREIELEIMVRDARLRQLQTLVSAGHSSLDAFKIFVEGGVQSRVTVSTSERMIEALLEYRTKVEPHPPEVEDLVFKFRQLREATERSIETPSSKRERESIEGILVSTSQSLEALRAQVDVMHSQAASANLNTGDLLNSRGS